MQVLKQRVSRAVRHRKRRRAPAGQMRLWEEAPVVSHRRFWQRRFYDFNVWTRKKRNEKMNYMHFNPVKRGLVAHPKDWLWSSYRFYSTGELGVCPPNPEWIRETVKSRRYLAHPSEKRRAAAPIEFLPGRNELGCEPLMRGLVLCATKIQNRGAATRPNILINTGRDDGA